MSIINSNPDQLALLMTLIAMSLSEDRDPNEVNVVGNVIITSHPAVLKPSVSSGCNPFQLFKLL